MKRNAIIIAMLAGLTAETAFAGTVGPEAPLAGLSWVSTISIGPVWAFGGETQTIHPTADITQTYVAQKTSYNLVVGDWFIGRQMALSREMLGQFGFEFEATDSAQLQGAIWDDGEPPFKNYTYKYSVQHTHVSLKGKFLLDQRNWMLPWVSGSIGLGFNDAHDFHSRPIIYEAVPHPNFGNHTETSLTYSLGAGVQAVFSEHWQAGVGYVFSDWGRSQLARATCQTSNAGLSLDHLYTNGVLLNLTYLA